MLERRSLLDGVGGLADGAPPLVALDEVVVAAEFGDDTAEVVARYVFYDNSSWDDPHAGRTDDDAIAVDKRALLPGQTATFPNYTSYVRGINGVMVDVAGLPEQTLLDYADFRFRVGNDNTPIAWIGGPVPTGITVRPNAGIADSDRVTLTWAENAIANTWLQVTVLATRNTGLAKPDVFYFGNAIGESGNSIGDAKVTSVDEIGVRSGARIFEITTIDDPHDFNRDAMVTSIDQIIVRRHVSTFDDLRLVTVPLPEDQIADRRTDEDYLDRQVKHISDADLFAALDLNRAELAGVKSAVEAGGYSAAYRAWGAYWEAKDKLDWVEHENKLQPISELAAQLQADASLVTQAVADAEGVMQHQINGWGSATHQHGEVVDFNFDYGTSGKYGFHYWGWSVPLLTAFHATGDVQYLAEFDRLFNQWYEQRDAVEGAIANLDVIWYPLGLGLRNRVFLHCYTCPFAQRSVETHQRMLKTVLGAARWLYESQRRGYQGGNWQIMASYGLADIAARLPEFLEASRWLDVGVKRLAEHVEDDFLEDGAHSERTPTSYMVIAYRDLRNLVALLNAAGVETEETEQFGARLEQILQWWMLVANPLGGLPAMNDGGDRALPIDALRDAAVLYGRDDFLYVADRLGSGAAETEGRMPALTSVNLEPSGVAVFRSGWQPDDNYLLVNYGTEDRSHTHRATLDFELFGRGAALAVDAGMGPSYDDPLHYPWYTTAKAHNMLVVDEANVDKAAARGYDVLWHSDPPLDVFAATYDGYLQSKGVTHRRAVAFIKPDMFVVFDSATAEMDGQTLSWYFHSPTDLTVGEAGRVVSADGPGVLLMEAWPEELIGVREGRGTASLAQFGGLQEIDWIAYDKPTEVGDDNRFAVLMIPFAESPPEVEFTALPSPPGTAALQIRRQATTDWLIFGNGQPLHLLDGRLVTDGAFAWVRDDGTGQLRGTLLDGETLIFDGLPVAVQI